MKAICINLHAHQPFRFRRYRFFDIGNDHYYYDDFANENTMVKAASRTYLPTNKLLLEMIRKHNDLFKISFTISGLAIEQFEQYAPEVLNSFKALAKTGKVEFIATPYSYSLSSLNNSESFKKEVQKQVDLIEFHFGQKPKILCNTELIYSDDIATIAAQMGFKGILTEGAKHILGWKSPNYLYQSATNKNLKIFMRNFQLCDDLSFRFSNHSWNQFPLTANKYIEWITANPKEDIINLFLGYDVFGGFQSAETGIFDFLKALPNAVANTEHTFVTPSEAMATLDTKSILSVPEPISWTNEERDLSVWLGNSLQNEAFNSLNKLEEKMSMVSDWALNHDWDCLRSCNHNYLMGKQFYTKMNPHLDSHGFDSPYEAFINYMNILSDFELRLNNFVPDKKHEQELDLMNELLTEKDIALKKCQAELKRLKAKNKK